MSFKQSFIFCLCLFIIPTGIFASSQRLQDRANLLTSQEASDIERALNEVAQETNSDLFILFIDSIYEPGQENIYTTESEHLSLLRQYVETFYASLGNDGRDGIVMIVVMDERDIGFYTFGNKIAQYESHIDRIIKRLAKPLKAQQYADACYTFMRIVTPWTYLEHVGIVARSWIPILIAVLGSLIMTLILSINLKGKKLVTNKTYEKENSFKLIDTKDTYIKTTRTQTKISSSSSGGGGSSGGSSGGGSGKF